MWTLLRSRLRGFFDIDAQPLSAAERWRSSLGALLFVGGAGLLLHAWPVGAFWLLAPVGASTVILYALPHSPVAAPWALLGSYLVGTACGVAAWLLVPYPPLAAALGVAACVWGMARLNCIHPPGGAVPLMMVLAAPSSTGALGTLAAAAVVNVLLMLAFAVLINNLVLRRRYPWHAQQVAPNPHHTQDAPPSERVGLMHEDLEYAFKRLDAFVDVQEGELVTLYNLAVEHAFERHAGLTCGDLMSRDLVTVTYSTELDDAWGELHLHGIRALPVVDGFGRLQGIVTVTDFLRQLDAAPFPALGVRLKDLLRRTPGLHSEKPEVVGQIMTRVVYTADTGTSISELVHAIAEHDIHHIPVLDESRRVVGMVTPTDINAALYRQIALGLPAEI
ncbi:MAG: CBS domain-containing protein [Betaproteobacteria bacterium]|nr:CBS domain-containing protein [Betaproteobacteria bacterium]MDE2132145.1 CBS domain-containing protein [Betaproteobacteria bacterium]MDE2211613.1 CBS domain-containing protein [Betaproteobacteria bacterium]